MPFSVYVTADFDQMSQVAAELVIAGARAGQASGGDYVLGLATGNTPTGLYKHLAKAFNAGRIDPRRVRTFNLDEYVGLPGDNPQQAALHPESYSWFMVSELFGLVERRLRETCLPPGTLVDQAALDRALEEQQDEYELRGTDRGRAVVIKDNATGVLRAIKEEVLDAYAARIEAAGGIDLQVIGVGGRGHVAFHESGIPFDAGPVMLVKLDDSTVADAVADGHFESAADCPRYAVSMGASLVFGARTVVLLANGERKAEPVAASIFGDASPDVPISYGRYMVERGATLVYVLDEAAAAVLLGRRREFEARGGVLLDLRGQPYTRVASLAFARDPVSRRLR
ncbi:MAG: glucosamine-6-phosphate deaminase [Chloroflexi bacterium]|jgi:glucosamine-6-phosphate deaminase|nr:glucosamine-6-phosphate deaminase [Chloroflexota bacterium]